MTTTIDEHRFPQVMPHLKCSRRSSTLGVPHRLGLGEGEDAARGRAAAPSSRAPPPAPTRRRPRQGGPPGSGSLRPRAPARPSPRRRHLARGGSGQVERPTASCEASHGATSAVEPVSTLTTPPGRSEVASTSDSVIAGQRPLLDGQDDAGVPGHDHRRDHRDQPEQATACGARTATTPVGSGTERLKYGPGHRVRVAGDLRDLVAPPGVPDPAVDGGVTSAPRRPRPAPGPCVQALSGRDLRDELVAPALEHLGDPVEHLAAVVRRRAGPAAAAFSAATTASRASLREATAALARKRPSAARHRVGAARLAAREGAADEQLVRLPDVDADVGRARLGSVTPTPPSRRRPGPGARPRGRSPDSLYPPNGLAGSNRLNVLAHTTPARSWSAIQRMLEPFSVHTPADSP